MSLKNKVVIVTGSSSGIGAAAAIEFAKEGANVILVGRNEKKLSNVSAEICKIGNKPLVIKADVSHDYEAKRIIDETIKRYGQLDVLVNNAGFTRNGSLLDGKILTAYDEIMATNLRAVVHLTSLAAPHLIKSKGNIVNISSIAAEMIPKIPDLVTYCTSKAGLNHFSRGAALELAEHGVRVNVVSPGPVITDFVENSGATFKIEDLAQKTPLKRVSQPIEIAHLIIFLASEKAKGITGSVFVSDNGAILNSSEI